MRNRADHEPRWESFEPIDWPDDEFEIDDDDFARAIAEGRGEKVAA